ncbi:MAG: DUF1156 domain-containing protein [Promethearchaeota archaeon]
MTNKRFIETDFPIKEVSKESTREKNRRYGNISTLHVWWARRPLAASRSSIYASLIPFSENQETHRKTTQFISELSNWASSNQELLLKKARNNILEANNGFIPKVIDPFAGGGAIPLEIMRLGCKTYVNELNPVAILIEKATLEFPQRYGFKSNKIDNLGEKELLKDVNKWAQWVLTATKKSSLCFYSENSEQPIPIGYLWARTVKCQNPLCKVEIPLLRQTWLVKKKKRKIALQIIGNSQEKKIDFKIIENGRIDFDPSRGTISRAKVVCPLCNSTLDDKTLRKEAREGKMGERLLVIISYQPPKKGKSYRLATEKDCLIFRNAELKLIEKEKKLSREWGIAAIPDEPLPPVGALGFRVQRYGFLKWGDLFNARQKLVLLTFVEKVREAYRQMLGEGLDKNYAQAIVTYLALAVDMMAAFCNSLARWDNTSEAIKHVFARQTLSMLWDFVELCPFSGSTGSWESGWKYYLKVIDFTSTTKTMVPIITQGSATNLPYSDKFFDAVITDPPYYNYIPYADLSDFFYVWLKRLLIDIYPSLLAPPLTPKKEECIQNPVRHGGSNIQAKQFYETMITRAFREIHRVLKDQGLFILVFAHKSTEAWETILNALLRSGLYLTASWPIHTEMTGRLRDQQSAALASSIFLVCRKRAIKNEKIAYFSEIKSTIEERIFQKLEKFWDNQIRGSDFFISAIGPAMEIFGQYSRVETLNGEQLNAAELLEFIRMLVSEFMLKKILKSSQIGKIDCETRFYLLWRWLFGYAKVSFDDARKMSQAMGLELEQFWTRQSFIAKENSFIRVLGPLERIKSLLSEKHSYFMIDILHKALIYWEKNQRDQLITFLDSKGYLTNDLFWEVAQAIAEILPEGEKERQMLQGLLYNWRNHS